MQLLIKIYNSGKPEDSDYSDFDDMMTEEGDWDPRGTIGKQILKFGKVNYRHIDPIPGNMILGLFPLILLYEFLS